MYTRSRGRTQRTFHMAVEGKQVPLVLELLAAQGFEAEAEPFPAGAFRLRDEPFPLGSSLAAAFGLIYIQDRSSMLPPAMLAPGPGQAVLDMCAAPGGKTSLLAAMAGPEGLVLGVEPSRERLAVLRRNLQRLGRLTVCTAGLSSRQLPFEDCSWEAVLLDPPCSGWGTADRNPVVLSRWSGEKTLPMVRLQQELLAEAARLLAPGGRLLYSTCTTNRQENEEQAAFAASELDLAPLFLEEPPGFRVDRPRDPDLAGCLLVEHDTDGAGEPSPKEEPEPSGGGQGFFLALMEKAGEPAPACRSGTEVSDLPGRPLTPRELEGPWDLDRLPPGSLRAFGNRVVLLPAEAVERFPPALRWQGCVVGRLAKGGFRPDPLARGLLPKVPGPFDLVLDEAEEVQRLLGGQSFEAKEPTGKKGGRTSGPVGLYFRSLPLGWLARKGGRILLTGG